MKPLCEVVSQDVLPAVRALVAKKMIETYGFSQKKVAEMLGTTQPAVSQYMRKLRGQKTRMFEDYPEVLERINGLTESIARGEIATEQITPRFCEICKLMLKSGLICRLHRDMYPSLGSCSVCMDKSND